MKRQTTQLATLFLLLLNAPELSCRAMFLGQGLCLIGKDSVAALIDDVQGMVRLRPSSGL